MKSKYTTQWSMILLLAGLVPSLWADEEMKPAVPVQAPEEEVEESWEPGSRVRVEKSENGWQLYRDNKPYFIYGAGLRDAFSDTLMKELKDAGANSFRTWGTDNLDRMLRRAQQLDLSVTVGLWLQHERHGFDYRRTERVDTQLKRAQKIVRKFREHPSILLWGVGNETEWHPGTNALVYKAVNDVAGMIKREDPYHPTMIVLAELGSNNVKVANVMKYCPNIDILGVNTFGGARSLPQRLREAGWDKPYIVTEFGPYGPWEVPVTSWEAPLEQTSTEKEAFYGESYEKGVASEPAWCLGSYAFLWGQKQESTPTWFSMFTKQGAPFGPVDTMQEIWTGLKPENLAPRIEKLESRVALNKGLANAEYEASVVAHDPEGGDVKIAWEMMAESKKKPGMYLDNEPTPKKFPDQIITNIANKVVFKMPNKPGPYRMYVYVYDEEGKAATANFPFMVIK